MRKILRLLASRKMSGQMSPKHKGFFEKRMFADHLQRYEFASQPKYLKNMVVLDIACGDGYGCRILSKKAKQVVAVDNIAVNKQVGNIKFVRMEAVRFLEKNKERFDSIVSFETVEHIEDHEKYTYLLHKNLRKNGLLLMSTPNKLISDKLFGGTFNPYHFKEFYTQELRDILHKIFKNKPKIFRQRPVRKNQLIFSTLAAFLLKEKSEIVENNDSITGIDNIYLVRK